MLDKKTAKLINEQVTLEFYSAYLYLDFANFYRIRVLMALPTGLKSRPRKSAIMPCS